jgi:hypothetical protein
VRIGSAAATVAVCLLAASPAQALKVRYNAVNSTADPNAVSTVEAPCPDGFKVTGGGAFSNGDYQETRIQDSYPFDGPDGNAKPDDGWRATIWNTSSQFRNIEAQAICAKAKMKYVTAINPSGNFGKRAKCPKGSSVSGGGINVNEDFVAFYDIIESIPVNYPEGNSTAKAWFTFISGPGMAATAATVYAACMDDDDAKLKARREFFDSPMTSQAGGTVFCGPNEKPTGVGGAMPTQQSALVTMFGADSPLDANLRLDDGAMVTVDNNGAELVDAEAYVVCAK